MGRQRSKLRWWFSGRILACHAGDRGSTANAKTKFLNKYHCDEMLMQLQMSTSAHYSSHVVDLALSSSPPWPEFDSRVRNSRSNIFQRPNCRIFPKAIDLRPRFLSLINSCLPHIIFRTINSDNDALSLEKDFTNVEERSKNVNMKFID